MGHVLGYARVSTADQTGDGQVDELRAAGAERVFIDKASGKLDSRPELHEVLDRLLPGDT
jgi:DNA invertase Pin-like site-specific DNA recombinase